jgi:hypothetical protein
MGLLKRKRLRTPVGSGLIYVFFRWKITAKY